MKVCHIISMNDINEMGVITRGIFNECNGDHSWCHIDESAPVADVYILHCFKNQKYFPKFITWQPPHYDCEIISLIHSSEPCMPNKNSNTVVTITKAWQERLKELYNIESEMIYGGLHSDAFFGVNIDYSHQVFGKITRPEAGKYHQDWENIVSEILDENMQRECVIASNGYKKLNYLKHNRMKWIEGIKIDDTVAKKEFFGNLSVYTECHNDGGNAFVDTFCIAMLEGMACGLPVVLYKGLQEPMAEVLGDAGVICETIDEYKKELREMLNNKEKRVEYGRKARERAEYFSLEKMVQEWNKLLSRFS